MEWDAWRRLPALIEITAANDNAVNSQLPDAEQDGHPPRGLIARIESDRSGGAVGAKLPVTTEAPPRGEQASRTAALFVREKAVEPGDAELAELRRKANYG